MRNVYWRKWSGGLAVASIAAFLQFLALIATVWIMVRNGRRQLRAYIFPDKAALIDGTMMAPPMHIHVNEPGVIIAFRNSGQTPAYRVVNWAKIEVIEPLHENSLIVFRPAKQEDRTRADIG
jgi:hypothetical protein